MEPLREIGWTLTAEQNLMGEDITWLIALAHAVLWAFAWTQGQPMQTLSATLDLSPQTLYTTLRLVVRAMLWVRRGMLPLLPGDNSRLPDSRQLTRDQVNLAASLSQEFAVCAPPTCGC